MGTYKKKLIHHFHELNRRQRLRYHLIDRFRFSEQDRFFFEGSRKVPGQMFLAERRQLYETILKYKPRQCFEVGTHTGGGSTFFLASAFAELGTGKVVTIECEVSYYNFAKRSYEKYLRHLLPFVEFVHGSSMEAFLPYIDNNGVDCFFLDGADDAGQTVGQCRFFDPYFKPGTILMVHDWHEDKMKKLKPMLLEERGSWTKVVELGQPESPGFAIFRKSR